MRFPGGITVIPSQPGSPWANTYPLFNFVLNNSIYQILGNLTELKDQLKLGLNLRSYEVLLIEFLVEIVGFYIELCFSKIMLNFCQILAENIFAVQE